MPGNLAWIHGVSQSLARSSCGVGNVVASVRSELWRNFVVFLTGGLCAKIFPFSAVQTLRPARKHLPETGARNSSAAGITLCPKLHYHHKELITPLRSRITAALGSFGVFIWVSGAEIPVPDQEAC